MANRFETEILATGQSRTEDLIKRARSDGLSFWAKGPGDTSLQAPQVDQAFEKSNASYSGTDCLVAAIYKENIVILGNVEVFSYSIFREKSPVRVLGHTYSKGTTKGTRTISGTIVFITFDKHPLYPLLQFMTPDDNSRNRFTSPLADDIPPFDIMLMFSNEYGYNSIIKLFAVELFQEGGVFSINDIYSENTMQYIARDMDPMVSSMDINEWKQLMFRKQMQGQVIDNYFASMLQYKASLETKISTLEAQRAQLQRTQTTTRVMTLGIAAATSRNKARDTEIQAKENNIVKYQKELIRTNNAIDSYERQKLTWDHNYALDRTPNDGTRN